MRTEHANLQRAAPHQRIPACERRKRKDRAPAAAQTPLAENDPFAQTEAPNTLHRHGSEFTDHLRTTERRSRPAYEPGAEQEVPNIQGDKQRHAAPEVARRLERDIAIHKEIERAGTRDGDAVCNARRQRELGQGKHAELDECLHDRHAVIHKRLSNATSERRPIGPPFGVIALLREWLRRHFGGVIRPLAKTSPVTSSVGSRPTARRWIITNAAQSLDTKLLPGNTSPRTRCRPSRSDVGLFCNGISSFPTDARSPDTDAIPVAIDRGLFLGDMCLHVFHRRDSKTHTQTPLKRYLFVAVGEEVPREPREPRDPTSAMALPQS